jgi:hypothetical protein
LCFVYSKAPGLVFADLIKRRLVRNLIYMYYCHGPMTEHMTSPSQYRGHEEKYYAPQKLKGTELLTS